MTYDPYIRNRPTSLVEALDRIIHTGVVIQGDAQISLADVELIYLGLKLVLCSSVRLRMPMQSVTLNPSVPPPAPRLPRAPLPVPVDGEPRPERGLAQLVLTLVELLRQLMERQAIHRMERGTVTDDQINRMGDALLQIQLCMTELKVYFGLTDDDLNIDLGPLGPLVD